MARHPYLDVAGPIAFAHRGGASVHPENTMRAFSHAVSLGYSYLETDVHATSDGVAIAFHDSSLDRVTDRDGVISATAWRDVSRARVDGTDEIVRLDELLEAFPRARLNLDPKSDHAVEPLVEVLRRTNSIDRVCVTSFSDRRTKRVRRLVGPSLCVGAGPLAIARIVAASWRVPAGGFRFDAAQVPATLRGVPVVRQSFVDAAHRRGVAVHVWTIDEPAEMHRLLDLGVDGIMTDRPEALRAVFEERGIWPTA